MVEPLPLAVRACRPTKNSALKNPVGFVPSSGRPCSELTIVTSGNERRIARICGTMRDDSSNEIVYGIVARTQSEPSSSFGMNSAPINARPASATTKSAERGADDEARARHGPVERARVALLQPSERLVHALRRAATQQRSRTAPGMTVSVTISAPMSAKIVVSAIGSNSRPDGPVST